jgi:hypothetical protein
MSTASPFARATGAITLRVIDYTDGGRTLCLGNPQHVATWLAGQPDTAQFTVPHAHPSSRGGLSTSGHNAALNPSVGGRRISTSP